MEHGSLFETLLQSRVPSGLGGRWYGVYPAIVSDIKDPDSTGRVKVTLPWSPDTAQERYEIWARLATLMGGNKRGSWFVPDVNDEVLVVFEGGDVRRPYVIGSLWNGSDAPPQSMDSGGRNFKKVLKSRNGVQVTLDDADGKETFIAETPGGQKVTLKDGPGSVEIADSNGNSIKLAASGVTITASASVTINASSVTISASSLTHSGTATISGALTAASNVTTPSVIGASYTPGAGNVW
jgi:uncharacterized protein involved in type VI secretion and phage assembly